MQSAKENTTNTSNQNENKHTNLNWAEKQNLNLNSGPMNGTQYSMPPAYYNAPYPFQAYPVPEGNNNWSNGEPIPYMGQVNSDGYPVDYTNAYTGQYGNTTQVTTGYNYYTGNPAYSGWNRNTDYYVNGAYSGITQGVQSMQVSSNSDKNFSSYGEKKISWASVAKQPAKPVPHMSSSGTKKKGPGMPPLPVIPRKSNIILSTEIRENKLIKPPTLQFPPDPVWSRTIPPPNVPPPSIISSMAYSSPPICSVQSIPTVIPSVAIEKKKSPSPQPPSPQPVQRITPKEQKIAPTEQRTSSKEPSPQPQVLKEPGKEPAVLDKLKDKNNYNPTNFDLRAVGARFFVIKSYSEDDIHRSIKYEIWCSTERGNKRLDEAFNERKSKNGMVYLLFSVNGSGHFCGMAKMMSSVDYGSSSTIWAQDKWKGQFKVHWIYVKDVPNSQLRHIRLENNDNKPVSNSRDTQEVPHDKGVEVLNIIHTYPYTTSIFDDFIHYEKRQFEDTTAKKNTSSHSTANSFQNKSTEFSREFPFKNKEWDGLTNHNRKWSGRSNRGYNNQGQSSNHNFHGDRKY